MSHTVYIYPFKQLKLHCKILFPGDGMPEASACNGSNPQFSGASSFLPGQNVTFTCSVPVDHIAWYSPQFDTLGAAFLTHTFGYLRLSRLDGAITFYLGEFMSSPTPCATSTATITNIQESMQGLTLGCTYNGIGWTTVIDVVGKLYIVPKMMLNFYDVIS